MKNNRILKTVGVINPEIIDKYNLYEYSNRKIVQSLDLYFHIYKNMKEFKSMASYNNAISNIELIIDQPDFVYYDKLRKSLLYFKKIDENVCVVVKLRLHKHYNYVATIYPISKAKINRLIEKSYMV